MRPSIVRTRVRARRTSSLADSRTPPASSMHCPTALLSSGSVAMSLNGTVTGSRPKYPVASASRAAALTARCSLAAPSSSDATACSPGPLSRPPRAARVSACPHCTAGVWQVWCDACHIRPAPAAESQFTPRPTHLRGLDAAEIQIASKLCFQRVHRPGLSQGRLAQRLGGRRRQRGGGALAQRRLCKGRHLRVGVGEVDGWVWSGAAAGDELAIEQALPCPTAMHAPGCTAGPSQAWPEWP